MTEQDHAGRWQRLLPTDPTLAIVTIAACVHLVRRAPLDTFAFAATAVLIVADRHHTLRRRGALDSRLAELDPRWGDVAAVVYGAVIGLLVAGSLGAKLVMAVPGIVAAAAVLGARPADVAAPATADANDAARRVRPWAVLFVAAALWELCSFVQQPSPTVDSHDHPVLTSLIGPLLDSPWRRAMVAAVWFGAGWRLVRIIVRGAAVEVEPQASRSSDVHRREAH